MRADPLQLRPWRNLAQAYAAAQLEPQRAYAANQARRLEPLNASQPAAARAQSAEAAEAATPTAAAMALTGRTAVSPGPGAPMPGTPAAVPSATGAEGLLRDPDQQPALAWALALRAWLARCPGDWLSWLYLARLLDGRLVQARSQPEAEPSTGSALHQAEGLEPIPGESRHWLGVWRLGGGDPSGAVAALAPLVDRQPPRHGSLLQLGLALLRTGNPTAAELAFSRASASSNPAFLRLLAQRVYEHNYWREAIAVLRRALSLVPDDLASLEALARLYWEVYQLREAEDLCHHILRLDPQNSEVPYLLNALPGRRGDARAHLAAVEAHYAALGDPGSRLASSIAMASLYVDDRTPEQIAALHRSLCTRIEAAVTPCKVLARDRDPNRPLRIGLVSGDFHRQHPVNLFMLPLLERLDRQRFPVWVFHTGSMHDVYTARASQAASCWIEAASLDDQTLQQRIRAADIDILIDLAGHTTSHRLGVFALRAAPVQATFLGYPHSTGLQRIDWLIGDAVVSPAAHAHLFTEGIAQLPGSVFCWSPVDDYPLPPPRTADAPLVLGSFNNVMKLSPRTIRLWAALLRDLPEASLLLKAPSLGDGSVVERFTGLFAAEGIGADRLRFEGPCELGEMMQRYGAIDIALDPTPYNGGTTTLQALWMGVPVISLLGGNFVSRMGASFLSALGRPEWIASSDDQYRAIALELVSQLGDLRQQRPSLRQAMASSGLSDLDAYADRFQRLLRRMWRSHCAQGGDTPPSKLLEAQA